MKFNKIKGKIADELDLPDNILTDNSNIIITGNRKIIIESHDGIYTYEKDIVSINSKYQIISIKGIDLKIGEIDNFRIIIEGKINEIKIKQKE